MNYSATSNRASCLKIIKNIFAVSTISVTFIIFFPQVFRCYYHRVSKRFLSSIRQELKKRPQQDATAFLLSSFFQEQLNIILKFQYLSVLPVVLFLVNILHFVQKPEFRPVRILHQTLISLQVQ